MKFNVNRDEMRRVLQHVTRVIEQGQTREILSNALVRIDEKNNLHLGCTDLEMSVSSVLPLSDVDEVGQVTIPGLKMFEIISSLPANASVEISSNDSKVTLATGLSTFTLPTMSQDLGIDFSIPEDVVVLQMQSKDLLKMLLRVSVAMGKNDVRFYLNGMLFEVTSAHVRTVATDGTRLAIFTLPGGIPEIERLHSIIPRKAVGELIFMLGDADGEATVSVDRKSLSVECGGHLLTTNLIDTSYPQYENVIVPASDRVVGCDRALLRDSLRRAVILSSTRDYMVMIEFDNEQMSLEASNEHGQKAQVSVPIDQYAVGESLRYRFNGKILTEVLDTIQTEFVELHFPEAHKNVRLCGTTDDEDLFYVISPMKL